MSLTFGSPTFGAPRRRQTPSEELPAEVDVAAEFDVDKVRRIAEFRTGMVHPDGDDV